MAFDRSRANPRIRYDLPGTPDYLTEFQAVQAAADARMHAGQRPSIRTADGAAEQHPPQHLTGIYAWHDRAQYLLSQLYGAINGSGPITASTRTDARDAARSLIGEMSKNCMSAAGLEALLVNWFSSAGAAHESNRLRTEIAAQFSGAMRPLVHAYLQQAYAGFQVEGNSPQLRQELKDGLALLPESRGLAYWLAHYHIMAGQYAEAYAVAQAAPSDAHDVKNYIMPKLDPGAAKAPWLTHPANFYTYRRTLISTSQAQEFQEYFTLNKTEPAHSLAGTCAMQAIILWNKANDDMSQGKYASADRNYTACRQAILEYFVARFSGFTVPSTPQAQYGQLVAVANKRVDYSGTRVGKHFRMRHQALDLDELEDHDWKQPHHAPAAYAVWQGPENFLAAMKARQEKVQEKVDAPLLAMALVHCGLGLAEANRLRRNFDRALQECRALEERHQELKLLSQGIEVPFVRILKAQILLEKGDARYKARDTGGARDSYMGVMDALRDEGNYIQLVGQGATTLQAAVDTALQKGFHPLSVAQKPPVGESAPAQLLSLTDRQTLLSTLQEVPLPTVAARRGTLPGVGRGDAPHESLLEFRPPTGQVMRETNPLIYALVLEAKARLIQLDAGLNFLGYSDEYVPPWRFQFLLTRARYFTEHAKQAQAEYITFLKTAESEEYYENSMAQSVALEKANINVEGARVDQSRAELEVARQSKELADMVRWHASEKVANFRQFMERADDLADQAMLGTFLSAVGSVVTGFTTNKGPGGGIGAIIGGVGSLVSQDAQNQLAAEQRDLELKSLHMAAGEARKAAAVAGAQVDVANKALVVAGLNRGTALLRHEFATQNLMFLRNRTLNAETWYRLAHMMRGISETYLRYAVEVAFLAEQAYEFEAGKQMNVIRFDYDVSEFGSMLAGDFLLADLDHLEHDLLVNTQTRQQQVKLTVSLARDYPSAMQSLRSGGTALFALGLDQMEQRFPGLHNLRIGSVEVTPFALMDASRFCLQLTYMGSSQIRHGSGVPGTAGTASPVQSWAPNVDKVWPVKLQMTGPETAFYTGLTRAERDSVFAFESANQRGAFENLGAAASWRIDMSLKENRLDSSTLADMAITFTLSGYFDPALRREVESASQTAILPVTQYLSARQSFPDAFYSFNRTGVMQWAARPDALTWGATGGTLRNLGLLLLPDPAGPQFSRIACSWLADVRIDPATGSLQLLSELPDIAFRASGLALTATAVVSSGAGVSWDFGDGTPIVAGTPATHQYLRPGRYVVSLRVEKEGALREFRAEVLVSRSHALTMPITLKPTIAAASATKLSLSAAAPTGTAVQFLWRLLPEGTVKSGPAATFDVQAGKTYTVQFVAMRQLQGRLYSRQQYKPDQPVTINGFRAATNRTFSQQGAETTTGPNPLVAHVFGGRALLPADEWTLALPPGENPCLQGVTADDQVVADMSPFADVVLMMEYTTGR